MSEYGDIALAYDEYARTGTWDGITRGLIYTCNAGWLDLGHLNPTNPRMVIGARNLWAQVERGGPDARREECRQDSMFNSVERWALNCHNDPYFRFSDGSRGYIVHSRQDHAGYPGRPGAEGKFIVRHGLTENQKKSVALSIFMNVSHRFERLQRVLGLGGLVTDSGYSQEDLVSNLVGFYVALGEMSHSAAIRLAHPVSKETAQAVWQRYGAVGETKNTDFSPILRDTGVVDDVAQMCRDDCVTQPRRFPEAFQTIRPQEPGINYHSLIFVNDTFSFQ